MRAIVHEQRNGTRLRRDLWPKFVPLKTEVSTTKGRIQELLTSIYPPHLPFELIRRAVTRGIKILDLHILNIREPRYCTHFKKTHSATYIPWANNTPRSIQLGRIKTECIRYLRTNSHPQYYYAAVHRMNRACLRLGYPKYMCSEAELQWSPKARYKVQQAMGEKEGAFLDKRVHVWRIPYASNVQLRYSAMIKRLQQKVNRYVLGTQLYAILQPRKSLRRRWHSAMLNTLNQTKENCPPPPESPLGTAELLSALKRTADTPHKRQQIARESARQHTRKWSLLCVFCI